MAFVASVVHSASRPKNHANPGRSLSPELRNPATRPVPSSGLVARPLSMPILAQRNAALSRSSGVVMESVSRSRAISMSIGLPWWPVPARRWDSCCCVPGSVPAIASPSCLPGFPGDGSWLRSARLSSAPRAATPGYRGCWPRHAHRRCPGASFPRPRVRTPGRRSRLADGRTTDPWARRRGLRDVPSCPDRGAVASRPGRPPAARRAAPATDRRPASAAWRSRSACC